ncbi:TetR family transcriptional regulator [Streptomyces sp. WAC 01529]|uniref:TetR family transcriptional regulator n=1 Tax=Streptomyces sp. WAC 01529 TaxID=2203205 RepID=UPI000F7044DC|nr:TetR family transcriptional regulator [Streptomyces sp. WAC 01529]AZM53130.1 TetR family transcriptional regulator [Streptomyces sp. WAC 01529]
MAATAAPLTPERILEATEEVLRRHGAAKATVVDVARALGVSHGTVYRHFRTKSELRGAVTRRWLDRTSETLSGIVTGTEPPEAKLRHWLAGLFDAKQHKAGDDPELFATYTVLADENSDVVDDHIADLTGQLAAIIQQGVERGEFASPSPATSARAVFDATSRFHDPAYAPHWSRPGIETDFEAVLDLTVRGLRA